MTEKIKIPNLSIRSVETEYNRYKEKILKFDFVLMLVLTSLFGAAVSGCGYEFGPRDRSMPGGFKKIAVPVFKNRTSEPIIETYFTNALLGEFQKAKIVDVVPKSLAEVVVEGEISQLKYSREGFLEPGDLSNLPQETYLATEYEILVECQIRVRRIHDGEILWQNLFRGKKVHSASKITTPGLNSANPLYNLSARRQNFELLAQDLMAEAYSRMTENF